MEQEQSRSLKNVTPLISDSLTAHQPTLGKVLTSKSHRLSDLGGPYATQSQTKQIHGPCEMYPWAALWTLLVQMIQCVEHVDLKLLGQVRFPVRSYRTLEQ